MREYCDLARLSNQSTTGLGLGNDFLVTSPTHTHTHTRTLEELLILLNLLKKRDFSFLASLSLV